MQTVVRRLLWDVGENLQVAASVVPRVSPWPGGAVVSAWQWVAGGTMVVVVAVRRPVRAVAEGGKNAGREVISRPAACQWSSPRAMPAVWAVVSPDIHTLSLGDIHRV